MTNVRNRAVVGTNTNTGCVSKDVVEKNTRPLTFYDWMIKTYLGKDNRRGDLAYDMQYEKETWPEANTKQAILYYLTVVHSACDACVDTFHACWKSYRAYVRKAEKLLADAVDTADADATEADAGDEVIGSHDAHTWR